jgi:alpha-D-ribose 1-methylphosphonate 5-triphosphate synthase subunit PhnG
MIISIFTRASAADVIAMADSVLPSMSEIEVVSNRSGIVMMPARDTVRGDVFHLGEALVAEAHIRLRDSGVAGYGAVLGRDTRHALAVAILDTALRAGIEVDGIQAFAERQRAILEAADADLLSKVASTRVVMETF